VDVVAVDDVVSDDPELTLPHPRATERAFVLVPWLAADPQARLSGRSVAALVEELPGEDVANLRRRDDLVLR
jgi:2-amino-4-hydroxy-6-hydroxymethyldihydropteridine diphosphokinase